MKRTGLTLAALLSTIVFPYPLTVVFSFVASLFFFPAALFAGVLADLLYHAPGAESFPFATLIGAGISVLAVLVRRFVSSRIMSA